MDMSELVPIIVIPTLCLMIGWLAWILTRTRYLKVRSQIDLQKRLLEKFLSAQDIVQFIQTEEGRQFIEAISTERPTALEELLSSVQKGVIFTMIGMGGLLLRLIFPMGFGLFIMASVFIGAVGIGFLISSVVAYRFSKNWGLITKSEAKNLYDRMRGRSLFW